MGDLLVPALPSLLSENPHLGCLQKLGKANRLFVLQNDSSRLGKATVRLRRNGNNFSAEHIEMIEQSVQSPGMRSRSAENKGKFSCVHSLQLRHTQREKQRPNYTPLDNSQISFARSREHFILLTTEQKTLPILRHGYACLGEGLLLEEYGIGGEALFCLSVRFSARPICGRWEHACLPIHLLFLN